MRLEIDSNFPNLPKFPKFPVLRSKQPRVIRAPRRSSGQISLPAMTTKSPFAKGGLRGNVNILYYTVYQPVLGFQRPTK